MKATRLRQLDSDEATRLGEVIRGALGQHFQLRFAHFENEIPRGAGGKSGEFVCRAS